MPVVIESAQERTCGILVTPGSGNDRIGMNLRVSPRSLTAQEKAPESLGFKGLFTSDLVVWSILQTDELRDIPGFREFFRENAEFRTRKGIIDGPLPRTKPHLTSVWPCWNSKFPARANREFFSGEQGSIGK